MSKLVKLTDPKEIAAAREYLALGEKFKEHVAFLTKKYNEGLLAATVSFNKKFREHFIAATSKHVSDADAVYADKSYPILTNGFDPDGPVYLMSREEWTKYMEPPEPAPVDHSGAVADRVLH
jgi:hypothetical protein